MPVARSGAFQFINVTTSSWGQPKLKVPNDTVKRIVTYFSVKRDGFVICLLNLQ